MDKKLKPIYKSAEKEFIQMILRDSQRLVIFMQ